MRLQEPPEIPAPGAPLFFGPPRSLSRHPEVPARSAGLEGCTGRAVALRVSLRSHLRVTDPWFACAPRPRRAHHCLPFEQGVRMADDVPFRKSFDLEPDTVKEVAPLVRAVAANNPSPFTFKGTVSYIIGRGK